MNPVFLRISVQAELKRDDHPALKAMPLWRRMTPLQKAVMSVLVKALERDKELFAQLAASEAPLYFTSAYGELGAMLRVTQDIESHSLPISPKDFQHSVLNAAIAYLCIHQGSHQPGLAISGGYESADLTLHLAARRIAAGMDAAAVIIHAHEASGKDEENAFAELLVLTGVDAADARYRLSFVEQSHERLDSPWNTEDAVLYDESLDQARVAWLLKDGRPDLKRCLRNVYGLELRTEWQERP